VIHALHHLGALAIAAAAVPALRSADWTHRSPRVAVVLWQATAFAAAAAAVGLSLTAGLHPYRRGIVPGLALFLGDLTGPAAMPPGVGLRNLVAVAAGLLLGTALCAALARATWSAALTRRRHRTLLTLLARHDARAGEAYVLDHPAAAAYCLPGRRPSIVLSAGALELLTAAQVRAVLAHERAHAAERHHLVLLPFVALRRIPGCRSAAAAVRLLIEMCADDRATRECARGDLADALERFAAAGHLGTPTGALAAAGRESGPPAGAGTDARLQVRIARLRGELRPSPVVARLALLAASLTLVATPLSLFALPWSP
jgi:Zn-dependent protease with chaperone function